MKKGTKYLLISMGHFFVAGCFVILGILMAGCSTAPFRLSGIEPTIPHPVCRHTVVADALFISERYSIYQIAVDPTISKHAQVRYKTSEGGEWIWYHQKTGWVPENFNPVLFFSIDEHLIYFRANYHQKKEP